MIRSAIIVRDRAIPVTITAHRLEVAPRDFGQAFEIEGLSDTAVRESRVRVRSALLAAGFEPPRGNVQIVIAGLPRGFKGTARLDLAIAFALLGEETDALVLGELSLGGELRAVRGVIPALHAEAERGPFRAVVPAANAGEVGVFGSLGGPTDGVRCYRTLREALEGGEGEPKAFIPPRREELSLDDVAGLDDVKAQLREAMAARKSVLLIGPPGSGKTMLARRAPALLGEMDRAEAMDAACIRSAVGLEAAAPARPFRAPHHTASRVAILGGGPTGAGRCGEADLARHGVLFLDELPEFRSDVLEAIGAVMRGKHERDGGQHVTVIGAMNPCPCGYFNVPTPGGSQGCGCTPEGIERYHARARRLPFDVVIEVPYRSAAQIRAARRTQG